MKLAAILLMSLCSPAYGMTLFERLLIHKFEGMSKNTEKRTQLDSIYHMNICKNQERQVKCDGGRTIRILEANFGRMDSTTCAGVNADRRCFSATATQHLKWLCYKQTSCMVYSTPEFFHNPPGCDDVDRYLYIKYQCEIPL